MSIFDEAYGGVPNWEIGRPQREFVTLEEGGEISRRRPGCRVRDRGERPLSRRARLRGPGSGFGAAGDQARPGKGAGARSPVTFLVQDALCLEDLGRTFDTIIDSGLFHALTDPERPCFARSLSAALRPGGTLLHAHPQRASNRANTATRRVTQPEIRAAFEDGWRVDWIRAGVFEGLKQPARVQGLAVLDHQGRIPP